MSARDLPGGDLVAIGAELTHSRGTGEPMDRFALTPVKFEMCEGRLLRRYKTILRVKPRDCARAAKALGAR